MSLTPEQVQELRALYNGDLARAPGVVALCDDWLRQREVVEAAIQHETVSRPLFRALARYDAGGEHA